MKKTNFRAFGIHFISWTVIFILPFLGFIFEPSRWDTVQVGFILMPICITIYLFGTFYLNLFYLAPKFLGKDKNVIYFLIIILLLGFFFLYNHLVFTGLIKLVDLTEEQRNANQPTQINQFFIRYLAPGLIFALAVLASNILFLITDRNQQKEKQQEVEIEKVANELNFLKLQISPHFLFNTLNNIRWLVRKQSDQAEESVIKLSEIMRYIIYDVESGKISIKQEIEHIQNYIELQTLRVAHGSHIIFKVDGQLGNEMVEPLLFLHFIENAFKYGIDGKNEPAIHFELRKTEKGIIFWSKNKILNSKSNLENEGVGLSNIQRRLELLYPDRHQLSIVNKDDYFEVTLSLQLDEY